MIWEFKTTDVVTGAILCDYIPLEASAIRVSVIDPDEIEGKLPKGSGIGFYSGLMLPRRTLLWAMLDGQPYAAGIVWSRDARSAASGEVSFKAQGLETIFDKRRIDETLTFTSKDPLDIFRSLVAYALAKPYGSIAHFTVDSDMLGSLTTMTYVGTDHYSVRSALDDLASAHSFEWRVVPYMSSTGTLSLKISFGKPQLTADSNRTLFHPGEIVDYDWPSRSLQAANNVLTTASSGANSTQMLSQLPHGVDYDDLNAGYPLLESVVSYSGTGTTTQAQLNLFADAQLGIQQKDAVAPTLTVALSDQLSLHDLPIGWSVGISLTSDYHPANGALPGLAATARMVDISISPSDYTASIALGEIS